MIELSDNNRGFSHYRWLCIVLIICISSISGYSQSSVLDKELDFKYEGSIYKALKAIEDETGYYFSYDADLFDADQLVSVNVVNETVSSILELILKESFYKFEVIGNQIVIYNLNLKEDNNIPNNISDSNHNNRIEGQIFEEGTNKPIPYATIAFKGKNRGVIANNDGIFNLVVLDSNSADTVIISCMGFKSNVYPMEYLQKGYNKIYLSEDYISIQEVVIRHVNPISIINQVLENLYKNYPKDPYNFVGFYRESIRKRSDYVAVAEVMVEGYKSRYQSASDNDQVKIIRGRKIVDNQNMDTILIKIQAGLNNMLLLDIVKNIPEFLSEERYDLYSYRLKDIESDGGEDVYVVGFEPKYLTDAALFKGNLYIDDKTRAIRSIDFQIQKACLDYASSTFIVKKPRGYNVKVGGVDYTVQYTKRDDFFYINYIKSELELKIRKKKGLFNTSYTLVNELVMTSNDFRNVQKFPFRETVKSTDFVQDKIKEYDDNFWGQYDYIPPEKSLLEAVELIINQ